MREHKRDIDKEKINHKNLHLHIKEIRRKERNPKNSTERKQLREEIQADMDKIRMEKPYKTACVDHQMKENHNFNFEDVKTLERAPQLRERRILEALHIYAEGKNAVNFKRDTDFIGQHAKQIINIYNKIRNNR